MAECFPLLDTSNIRNRLPLDSGRIPDRDNLFLNDYVDCYSQNTETVYLAYGDTIVLLKKIKVPQHEIVHSAPSGPRGMFGGRRQTQPTPHTVLTPTAPGRPDPASTIDIPAIVDLSPDTLKREQYGIVDPDVILIYLPRKWLDDRSIRIDRAEDRISYRESQYMLTQMELDGNFLDSYASFIIQAKRSS